MGVCVCVKMRGVSGGCVRVPAAGVCFCVGLLVLVSLCACARVCTYVCGRVFVVLVGISVGAWGGCGGAVVGVDVSEHGERGYVFDV